MTDPNHDQRAKDAASGLSDLVRGARDEIEGVDLSSPLDPAAGSILPDSIPGYQIVRRIHQGGQGVVYQATQESTGARVAIKVMRQGPFASDQDRERFDREIQILTRIRHPNIVPVRDAGVALGSHYFVMDYIHGVPLDVYLARGLTPRRESLELFARICDAVHAAHVRGVVHRDLKPANVIITSDGIPHVLDFGLAKVTSAEPAMTTMSGQFLGSLPWASPEQVNGDPLGLDIRADVYSLGVVLYQALTGRFPYDVTGSFTAVATRIAEESPMSPSLHRRDVDDELETILLQCLAKDPERRYQSADELARDLRRYLVGEPIAAKRDSALYLLRKTMTRYKIPTAIGIVLIVSGFVFGATMSTLYADARQEADAAQGLALRAKQESERLKQRYDGLVSGLEAERIDLQLDSLADMAAKQRRAQSLLGRFSEQVLEILIDSEEIATDYVRFRSATAPRVDGTVFRVGPQRQFTSLAAAMSEAGVGATLLLDAGEYELPSSRPNAIVDVAIIGAGRDVTTLTGQVENATRLRVASLAIQCNNDPFCDLRSGGSIHLLDCEVYGYNSGAGGSNSMFTSNGAVLLIEGCTFEGSSGRQQGRRFGNALDLRGTYLLYARDCQFIDNDEILRATDLSVFDGCFSRSASEHASGIQPYPGGRVFLRDNRALVRQRAEGIEEFTRSSDDREFVTAVLSEVEELKLLYPIRDSLTYWIGLHRHDDPAMREVARRRVAELVEVEMPTDLMASQSDVVPGHEIEASWLETWLEEHRDELVWNAQVGRYEIVR